MIGALAATSSQSFSVKAQGLRPSGVRKTAEAPSRNVEADAGSRINAVRWSGATADRRGLEAIGLLLLLATLFVICAGAFAVRHQVTTDLSRDGAGYGVHSREGWITCNGRAVVPSIIQCNFLM